MLGTLLGTSTPLYKGTAQSGAHPQAASSACSLACSAARERRPMPAGAAGSLGQQLRPVPQTPAYDRPVLAAQPGQCAPGSGAAHPRACAYACARTRTQR